MKITIDADQLLQCLAPCAEVTSKKSTSVWGRCLLLRASSSGLEVRAFGDTLSVVSALPADRVEVAEVGQVALPADDLLSRVNALAGHRLTLHTEGGKANPRVRISGAQTQYTMRPWADADYPAFPREGDHAFNVAGAGLASALRRTAHVAYVGSDQPRFQGVTVSVDHGKLLAYGSDGHRMARTSVDADGRFDGIIPTTAIKPILAMLGDGPVRIAATPQTVHVMAGQTTLAFQRPGVTPPPFAALMATMGQSSPVATERATLVAALKAVSVGASTPNVEVTMRWNGESIAITHRSPDGDEATASVPAEGVGEWAARLDARYLVDTLSRMTSETVRVHVDEDRSVPPCIVGDGDELVAVAQLAPQADEKRAA